MSTRPLVDTAGAAEHLGTTARHVRDLKARGKLPFVPLGRLVRFDLDELDRLRHELLVREAPEVERIAAAVASVVDNAPALTADQVAMLQAAGLRAKGQAA